MSTLTLDQVRQHSTPPGHISLWWLGQAGFLAQSPGGQVIAIDPYLSNSCKAVGDQHGFNFERLVPPPMRAEELAQANAVLFTHSHQDHCDPETLAASRNAGGHGLYIAPPETIEKLYVLGVPPNETLMIWPNKSLVLGDFRIRATFAIPFAGDDLTHVGYLVAVDGGPTVYFTGDTGWHDLLADAVAPHQPDVLVTVINPAFRNLSPAEAALLARRLNVKAVIPCHHDLFKDNCQPPQMLHTNLKLQGMGERFRLLRHGEAFDWPEEPASSFRHP
jgi:L-ascorbate 6-phosphate lactonase